MWKRTTHCVTAHGGMRAGLATVPWVAPVVLLTRPLPDPAHAMLAPLAELRVLDGAPDERELARAVADGVDVLVPQLVDPVSAAVLDAGAGRLRAVAVYAAGFDRVDVAAATARGIAVGNTPGVLTEATADCALGLLLAAARRLREGDAMVRAGEWTGWRPTGMLGLDLDGAVLGIVGLGRIGTALARRATACGMRVVAADLGRGTVGGDIPRLPLDDLLATADAVSLHVPLGPSTRHLIDEAALRRMRSTAVLVNTARGAVIDERALVRALREGWIAAAGLDVYEDEPQLAPGLVDLPNVVLAPHLGSATVRTRAAMAERAAANAVAALRGEPLPHCVNPEAWASGPPASLVTS